MLGKKSILIHLQKLMSKSRAHLQAIMRMCIGNECLCATDAKGPMKGIVLRLLAHVSDEVR